LSKIYRSLESRQTTVTEVDLARRPMSAPNPARPLGGFSGYRHGAPPVEMRSDIERREQESIELLEAARRQAEALQAEAYRAGFEQGERAGEKLVQQKIEPLLQNFLELIEAVRRERGNLIRQHEHELIKVAFSIATRVLGATLERQPEMVTGVIEAALAKLAGTQDATLTVSPYDRQLIEQQMRNCRGAAWPPEQLKLEADESVGRGGCRIQIAGGDIDATIETQLRGLKNLLWSE